MMDKKTKNQAHAEVGPGNLPSRVHGDKSCFGLELTPRSKVMWLNMSE